MTINIIEDLLFELIVDQKNKKTFLCYPPLSLALELYHENMFKAFNVKNSSYYPFYKTEDLQTLSLVKINNKSSYVISAKSLDRHCHKFSYSSAELKDFYLSPLTKGAIYFKISKKNSLVMKKSLKSFEIKISKIGINDLKNFINKVLLGTIEKEEKAKNSYFNLLEGF